MMSFFPLTRDHRSEAQIISSFILHLDDIQCGIRVLKMKQSPDQRGTATPNVGQQKYAVTIMYMIL